MIEQKNLTSQELKELMEIADLSSSTMPEHFRGDVLIKIQKDTNALFRQIDNNGNVKNHQQQRKERGDE